MSGHTLPRRTFLRYYAAAGLAGTAFPGLLWAEAAGGPINRPELEACESLAGLSFSDAERDLMLADLESLRVGYEELRQVPALLPRPRRSAPCRQRLPAQKRSSRSCPSFSWRPVCGVVSSPASSHRRLSRTARAARPGSGMRDHPHRGTGSGRSRPRRSRIRRGARPRPPAPPPTSPGTRRSPCRTASVATAPPPATSITFTGRLFEENEMIAVARAYQEAAGFHLRRPPLERKQERK